MLHPDRCNTNGHADKGRGTKACGNVLFEHPETQAATSQRHKTTSSCSQRLKSHRRAQAGSLLKRCYTKTSKKKKRANFRTILRRRIMLGSCCEGPSPRCRCLPNDHVIFVDGVPQGAVFVGKAVANDDAGSAFKAADKKKSNARPEERACIQSIKGGKGGGVSRGDAKKRNVERRLTFRCRPGSRHLRLRPGLWSASALRG